MNYQPPTGPQQPGPQQQPYYQQPPTNGSYPSDMYSPQFYEQQKAHYFQPAPVQQQQKPKRWPWVIALIVVFFVGVGVGNSGHSSSASTSANSMSQSTVAGGATAQSQPAKPQKWQTTHTFKGDGAKKTEVFQVSDNWKLQWRCDPASFGMSYNVQVDVNNSDNTPFDPVAVNTLCKSGNISGETNEHKSGTVYLDINSEAAWTITIQELK
jgi:hypothetical protein